MDFLNKNKNVQTKNKWIILYLSNSFKPFKIKWTLQATMCEILQIYEYNISLLELVWEYIIIHFIYLIIQVYKKINSIC